METLCKNCGNIVVVNIGGRKRTNISVTEVCDALVLRNNKKPWFAETARNLSLTKGCEIGRAVVKKRFAEYLLIKDLTLAEYLEQSTRIQEAKERQKRIKEKMTE